MKKYFLSFVIFCTIVNIAKAQEPSWSVTPSTYTYSLNVTTQLNVACITQQDSTDLVGAFVNNDCRGVEYTSNLVSGNQLAFLTIYSNIIVGDTVTFKLYDASADTVIDALTYIIFQDGDALGTPTNPYVIETKAQPSDFSLDSELVVEDSIGAFVGIISPIDTSGSNFYTYSFVSGTGDSENGNFQISSDSLFTNGALDFETLTNHSIRVAANNGSCEVEKMFNITITDVNESSTDIIISNSNIDENLAIGTLVGNFSSSDALTYSFATGTGDTDNANFTINGSSLLVNFFADFETKNSYSILVQTLDNEILIRQFTITIGDVNEAPVFQDTTFQVSENASINTIIGAVDFIDEDANDAHSFYFINNYSFETVDNKIELATELNYEDNSEFTLQLVIEDVGGLTDTATVSVIVLDEIESSTPLSVNLFLSPDGDGHNDYFVIENVYLYEDYSLIVFNNAGNIVYTVGSNYDNSWDAKYKGNVLSEGAYYYLFQSNLDKTVFYKGTVSIIH